MVTSSASHSDVTLFPVNGEILTASCGSTKRYKVLPSQGGLITPSGTHYYGMFYAKIQ